MQITLDNAQISVIQAPEGLRIIHVVDRASGIVVNIPLPADAARTVGTALTATVLVATQPLPNNGQPIH